MVSTGFIKARAALQLDADGHSPVRFVEAVKKDGDLPI